ncbi:MAG TPA: hypothetical protein VHQ64_10975, partial [Pyrinomonadaceae bacterium]|nr:hypothetical protein [Pyrinomonadaceae bacterium]
MKIEFITNASVLVTLASKKTVLCDPWYTDAIYYGSWYNFPPLANKKHYQSLKPSYIYISHIHPDHLDGESLRRYPRDTEIWLGNLP